MNRAERRSMPKARKGEALLYEFLHCRPGVGEPDMIGESGLMAFRRIEDAISAFEDFFLRDDASTEHGDEFVMFEVGKRNARGDEFYPEPELRMTSSACFDPNCPGVHAASALH